MLVSKAFPKTREQSVLAISMLLNCGGLGGRCTITGTTHFNVELVNMLVLSWIQIKWFILSSFSFYESSKNLLAFFTIFVEPRECNMGRGTRKTRQDSRRAEESSDNSICDEQLFRYVTNRASHNAAINISSPESLIFEDRIKAQLTVIASTLTLSCRGQTRLTSLSTFCEHQALEWLVVYTCEPAGLSKRFFTEWAPNENTSCLRLRCCVVGRILNLKNSFVQMGAIT